jgi:hypothetical protein
MSRFVKVMHAEFINVDRLAKIRSWNIAAVDPQPGVDEGEPAVYGIRVWYEGPSRPGADAFDLWEDFRYAEQQLRDKVMFDLTGGKIV